MPTTPDAASAAIEQRLRAAFPTTGILFPNAPFAPVAGVPFLRCHIVWGASMQSTMRPTQSNLNIGVVMIDVYVPQGEGGGRQRRLGEQVRAVFNRQEFGSVRCDGATGLVAHRDETWNNAAWWCATVKISFTVEELVPV